MDNWSDRGGWRFAVPQIFTALRAALGGWALFRAVEGDWNGAGILLIAGLVTDRLDGEAARRLGVESLFGYTFDCMSDYLFYTVVPAVLSYRMAGSPAGGWVLAALAVPLVTAPVRQSRNVERCARRAGGGESFLGLPTLVHGYYIVALVFLMREGQLSAELMPWVLGITAPLFAALSLTRLRYPKLASQRWFLAPVLVGLNLMPFVWTAPLAWATIALGAVYVVAAPFSGQEREARCPSAARS